jgi:hypothetical protein
MIERRQAGVSDVEKLPRWLKPMNRLIVALQRGGLVVGTMRVLSVPGRNSGRMQTTPVSPLVVGRRRYVVGGSAQADWVKNARAAGWGILARGRKEERVRLVELALEERAPVLREFPKQVPGGIAFFRSMYELPKEKEALPAAFAALAPRCAVFRLKGERMT